MRISFFHTQVLFLSILFCFSPHNTKSMRPSRAKQTWSNQACNSSDKRTRRRRKRDLEIFTFYLCQQYRTTTTTTNNRQKHKWNDNTQRINGWEIFQIQVMRIEHHRKKDVKEERSQKKKKKSLFFLLLLLLRVPCRQESQKEKGKKIDAPTSYSLVSIHTQKDCFNMTTSSLSFFLFTV